MGHADPWIFLPFQHRGSREQYRAFEISIAPSLCQASFRLTVRGAQGSQSALILFYARMIASRLLPVCMHFVVK
jgi:hypothetical protein